MGANRGKEISARCRRSMRREIDREIEREREREGKGAIIYNLADTMFDDDDDVEPPVSDVDNYYFEKSEDDPVCFSVLPIKFDENEEVRHCDYKEVNLRGVTDNNLKEVFKKVVAWRVELDCQEPKISVLSSEGKWIELLKPRKSYYEKRARSILITVQMLHFVRKWPRKQERSLFCHLTEVLEYYIIHPPFIPLLMSTNEL
uniref:RFTS domain-containing protein n=1 Tax=Oryza brachyantha TaxID=4533 RepID=J3MS91_ORYBR